MKYRFNFINLLCKKCCGNLLYRLSAQDKIVLGNFATFPSNICYLLLSVLLTLIKIIMKKCPILVYKKSLRIDRLSMNEESIT